MILHFCKYYFVLNGVAKCFNLTQISLLVLTLENLVFTSPIKVQIQELEAFNVRHSCFSKGTLLVATTCGQLS